MVIKGRLKPDREQYYQQQILNVFPDRFVEAPPKLTEAMTNAESDRHVTATAIAISVGCHERCLPRKVR